MLGCRKYLSEKRKAGAWGDSIVVQFYKTYGTGELLAEVLREIACTNNTLILPFIANLQSTSVNPLPVREKLECVHCIKHQNLIFINQVLRYVM